MTKQKNIQNSYEQSTYTLREIALMMDLTKERVRQIEAKALNRFRQKLFSLGYKESDLIGD